VWNELHRNLLKVSIIKAFNIKGDYYVKEYPLGQGIFGTQVVSGVGSTLYLRSLKS
jgi:hypothetical protein